MRRVAAGRRMGLAIIAISAFAIRGMAQDANSWFKKGEAEADSCVKMHDYCEAAKLEPGNKKFSEQCNKFRGPLVTSDLQSIKDASLALAQKKFDEATVYAGPSYVCRYDDAQWSKAQDILQQVKNAKNPPAPAVAVVPTPPAPVKVDQSAAMLNQARQQFKAGNFSEATAAASKVTDPNLLDSAAEIQGNISTYTKAMQDAQQKENGKDYSGAIQSYQRAADLLQNGPGNPVAQINRLKPLTQVAIVAPPPVAPAPVPAKPPGPQPPIEQKPVDNTAKIAALLADGNKALDAKDTRTASRDFNAVQHLDPDNAQAKEGLNKVAAQNALAMSDPRIREAKLTTAIQEFYKSDYDDARVDLDDYLRSPDAASKGAAYFYRAATILSKRILEKVEDKANAVSLVQENFRLARNAHYSPRREFVSPVVLQAWDESK